MKHTITLIKENNANVLGHFLSDDLPNIIPVLSDEYDINKIKIHSITGNYAKSLIYKIKDEEIKKYSKNKLEIEVI